MRIVLAIVIAIAVAPPAAGQEAPPSPVRLTLDEAITRGLEASHRLADVAARRDASEAIASQRHAVTLPQVAAQAGYMRTNHVDIFGLTNPTGQLEIIYPDIPDNYRTRLDLQWPIYTAGRLDALERAARAEAQASGADVETARADLRLEITRAYWALVTAAEAVRVVDASLRSMDAHLQDVRNQFNAGLVPPNDVSRVEAERSRQQMLTIQARTTREVVEADLARLTGIEPGTPIDAPTAFAPPARLERTPSDLVADALAHRPDRAALVSRAGAAAERVIASRAGRWPTIGVAGGVDYARPNPRIFPRLGEWRESWDAGVNLNWPVFDGGRVKAEIAEASASERAAQERLADFDVTMRAEVRQRASELASSDAAINAAADSVRAAEEAQRVINDRFHAGVATSTDLLDAQEALLQAELDRTRAIASARLAEARLARALGR